MSVSSNKVELLGKITKNEGLRYTPSGVAICDFRVAVLQKNFDKKSTGYFEAQMTGDLAEEYASVLKIGKKVSIDGELWMRTYRPRNGGLASEVKILVNSIQVEEK